jgi:hypothetical protein
MKKSKPQNITKASVRNRPTKKVARPDQDLLKIPVPKRPPHGWAVMGFDVSMSSMAGAAFGYDRTLNRYRGPAFVCRRWSKGDHYFDRLMMAAKSHELVLDLISELGMFLALDEVWIAQEEPFPPHSSFMSRGNSGFLKQQAEISGAFLGGLLRHGYRQIFQIHNQSWRKVVADGLTDAGFGNVTTHVSKWRDPKLAEIFNCRPADSGKFRAQQWAKDVFEPWSFPQTQVEIPEWPPIIERKDGKTPRPEGSVAKAVQSDDRYEALAMMEWLRLEIWEDELVPLMKKTA